MNTENRNNAEQPKWEAVLNGDRSYVFCGDNVIANCFSEAHAKLIAATPKLLSYLKDFEDNYSRGFGLDDDFLTETRQLIAEAEGSE